MYGTYGSRSFTARGFSHMFATMAVNTAFADNCGIVDGGGVQVSERWKVRDCGGAIRWFGCAILSGACH